MNRNSEDASARMSGGTRCCIALSVDPSHASASAMGTRNISSDQWLGGASTPSAYSGTQSTKAIAGTKAPTTSRSLDEGRTAAGSVQSAAGRFRKLCASPLALRLDRRHQNSKDDPVDEIEGIDEQRIARMRIGGPRRARAELTRCRRPPRTRKTSQAGRNVWPEPRFQGRHIIGTAEAIGECIEATGLSQ